MSSTRLTSPYKNGKGNIVRELSEACKKYDLKFAVLKKEWIEAMMKVGVEVFGNVYILCNLVGYFPSRWT